MTIDLETVATLGSFASTLLPGQSVLLGRFRLHLFIKRVTLNLNLQELLMNFIAHQLLDYIFLMFELILGLASLLGSLLLLD